MDWELSGQLLENKVDKMVVFLSRILIQTERKYSVIAKEVLVCIWAREK